MPSFAHGREIASCALFARQTALMTSELQLTRDWARTARVTLRQNVRRGWEWRGETCAHRASSQLKFRHGDPRAARDSSRPLPVLIWFMEEHPSR